MTSNTTVLLDSKFSKSEAYRYLRAYVEISLTKEEKFVLITSSNQKEGTSTVAVNLAIALANHYPRVLLIDGNLKKPSIHNFFDLENKNGFVHFIKEVEMNDQHLETLIQVYKNESMLNPISIMTVGQYSQNVEEYISTQVLMNLFSKLDDKFDLVLIDCPSPIYYPESVPLAQASDATILCVSERVTKVSEAEETVKLLRRSGVNILGVVFTNTRKKSNSILRVKI